MTTLTANILRVAGNNNSKEKMSLTEAAATKHSKSSLLRFKLSLLNGRVNATEDERFWSHPRLLEIFPEYLFLTHSVIRASVPILAAAQREARQRKDDPLCHALAAYLIQHIAEEQSHDEWLLDDLEILGHSRYEILRRLPPSAVAETAGAQYYWIHHIHPVAVLGYIAVLEGDPPREDEVRAAIARTGLPPDSFRTILSHATLDPGHKEEFEHFLDSLALTPEQESLIGVSAISTMAGMQRILGRLG